jgi:hypothetical protein
LVEELRGRLSECDVQLAAFEGRVGKMDRELRGAVEQGQALKRELQDVEGDAEEVMFADYPYVARHFL